MTYVDHLRAFKLWHWWRVKPLVLDVLDAYLAVSDEIVSHDLGNAVGRLQDAVER